MSRGGLEIIAEEDEDLENNNNEGEPEKYQGGVAFKSTENEDSSDWGENSKAVFV